MPLGAFATVRVFASRSGGALRLRLALRSAATLGLATASAAGLLYAFCTVAGGVGSAGLPTGADLRQDGTRSDSRPSGQDAVGPSATVEGNPRLIKRSQISETSRLSVGDGPARTAGRTAR